MYHKKYVRGVRVLINFFFSLRKQKKYTFMYKANV